VAIVSSSFDMIYSPAPLLSQYWMCGSLLRAFFPIVLHLPWLGGGGSINVLLLSPVPAQCASARSGSSSLGFGD